MAKTWTLVANASTAKLFEGSALSKPLSLIRTLNNPDARKADQDLSADRPGRRNDGSQFGKSSMDAADDAKDDAIHNFARDVAGMVNDGRKSHAFERLILVAEPKVLGELRQSLDSATQSLIVSAIDKDLAKMSVQEINTRLEKLVSL